MKKYEQEFKLRSECQEKVEKLKQKMRDMLEQWDRLKGIEAEYEPQKKRVSAGEKNLHKYETN